MDIFDRLATQKTSAGGGDIFDRLAADPNQKTLKSFDKNVDTPPQDGIVGGMNTNPIYPQYEPEPGRVEPQLTDIEKAGQSGRESFQFAAKTLEPKIAGTGRRKYNPQTGMWESPLPTELLPLPEGPRGSRSTGERVSGMPVMVTATKEYQDALQAAGSDATAQKKVRTAFLSKMQQESVKPVEAIAEQKGMDEAQKGRKKDYVDEWVRAWDRGSANVASGVLKTLVKGTTPSAQDDINKYAAAYHKAISSPELAPRKDGDWIEKGLSTVGETMPYMTATVAANMVAGSAGSFAVGAMVEGNSAYQDAKAAGVSEGKARAIGFAVGIANGAIENMGGGGGKYLKALTAKKIAGKLSGKQITKNALENAMKEALEEASQEFMTISGERVYKDVKWDEELKRVGMSAVAGFALGGPFSIAGDVMGNLNTPSSKDAELDSPWGGMAPGGLTPSQISALDQAQTVRENAATPAAKAGGRALAGDINATLQRIAETRPLQPGQRQRGDMLEGLNRIQSNPPENTPVTLLGDLNAQGRQEQPTPLLGDLNDPVQAARSRLAAKEAAKAPAFNRDVFDRLAAENNAKPSQPEPITPEVTKTGPTEDTMNQPITPPVGTQVDRASASTVGQETGVSSTEGTPVITPNRQYTPTVGKIQKAITDKGFDAKTFVQGFGNKQEVFDAVEYLEGAIEKGTYKVSDTLKKRISTVKKEAKKQGYGISSPVITASEPLQKGAVGEQAAPVTKPITVYHHSPVEVEQFDQEGVYFTSSEVGYGRRANAKFNNPRTIDLNSLKLANKKEATELGLFRGDKKKYIENLKNAGFDGAKYGEDGDTTYFIIDPSKITKPDTTGKAPAPAQAKEPWVLTDLQEQDELLKRGFSIGANAKEVRLYNTKTGEVLDRVEDPSDPIEVANDLIKKHNLLSSVSTVNTQRFKRVHPETALQDGYVYISRDENGDIDYDKSGRLYKGVKGTYYVGGTDGVKAKTIIKPKGTVEAVKLTPDILKQYPGLSSEGLAADKKAALASIREQAAKPVSEQVRDPQLRVVSPEKAPSKPALKPVRFETGKNLTKEQKKEVLSSVGDTYRESGIKKTELKGQDSNGDPRYGYPYSPETFRKSDITGKLIRHYVSLPDGRIAHPTELFPNLKQSEIDAAIYEQERAIKQTEARKQELLEIASKAKDLNDANMKAAQRGYAKLPNYVKDSVVLQKGDNFIRVMTGNDDIELLKAEGFVEIIRGGKEVSDFSSPSSEAGSAKAGPALSEAPTEKGPEEPEEIQQARKKSKELWSEMGGLGASRRTYVESDKLKADLQVELDKIAVYEAQRDLPALQKELEDTNKAIAKENKKTDNIIRFTNLENKRRLESKIETHLGSLRKSAPEPAVETTIEHAGEKYTVKALDMASVSDPKYITDGKSIYYVVKVRQQPVTRDQYGNPTPAYKFFTVRKLKPDGSQTKLEISKDSRKVSLQEAIKRPQVDNGGVNEGKAWGPVGNTAQDAPDYTETLDKLASDRAAALAAVREQAAKPVSEQVPSPSLRVVNSIAGEKKAPEIEKSKGHVAFYTYGKTTYELYKAANGELYRAPVGSVIDPDTGNRQGRFEAKASYADQAAENILNPKPMTPEIKVVPDKPVDSKKYYANQVIDDEGNKGLMEVKATKVILPGYEKLDTFYNKDKDGLWRVTEGKTGMSIGTGKTKKAEEKTPEPTTRTDKTIAVPKEDPKPKGTKRTVGEGETERSVTDFGDGFGMEGKNLIYIGPDGKPVQIVGDKYKLTAKENLRLMYGLKQKGIKANVNAEDFVKQIQDLHEREKAAGNEDADTKGIADFLSNIARSEPPLGEQFVPYKKFEVTYISDGHTKYRKAKSLEEMKTEIGRRLKKALGFAEFKKEPVFTIDKDGMLSYTRGNSTVRFWPSYFGLRTDADATELQYGDKVPVDLESFGIDTNLTAAEKKDFEAVNSNQTFPPPVTTGKDIEDMTYDGRTKDEVRQYHKQINEEQDRLSDYRSALDGLNGQFPHPDDIAKTAQEGKKAGRSKDAVLRSILQATKDAPLSVKETADMVDAAWGADVSENTLITDSAKDAAVARQEAKAAKAPRRGKRGGFLEVFDAEDLKDVGIIMAWHVEKGARTAVAFTKAAIEEFGEGVRKHLPDIWNTLKADGKVSGDYNPDDSTPNGGKSSRQKAQEARDRGEKTLGSVAAEVIKYRGKGGVSTETRSSGFRPAFRHSETGEVFESRNETGQLSGVHLFNGIPDKYVTERDSEDGIPLAVSGKIESGFIKDGEFYTRQEASDVIKGVAKEEPPSETPPAQEPPSPPASEPPAATEEPNLRVRGVAQSIEDDSLTLGIISEPGEYGPLPTYTVKNMQKAQDAVAEMDAKDPVRVMRIAMGSEAAPEGADQPTSADFFTFVRKRAELSGDGATIQSLLKSTVVTEEATKAGQFSKSLDTGIDQEGSAYNALGRVEDANTEAVERNTGRRTSEQLKAELNKKEELIRKLEIDKLILETENRRIQDTGAGPGTAPSKSGRRKGFGESNRLITKDRHEENRTKLKNIFSSQVNTGIDPRILEIAIEEGLYYLEGLSRQGVNTFAVWSEKMKADYGDKIAPYLKDAYTASVERMKEDSLKEIKAGIAKGDIIYKTGERIQDLARIFVGEGIRSHQALTEAVHAEMVKIVPKFTLRDTFDAISGYGKWRAASKNEVDVEIRRLKGEILQLSKLEAIKAKEALKATGSETVPPSDEKRRLIKEVNEAKRKGGYDTGNAANRLKSALATRETRLRNRIRDLKKEIVTRQKMVKSRTAPPTNNTIEELQAEVDALVKEHTAIFGKPGLTDAQKLAMSIKAAQRSITTLEERIASGNTAPLNAPSTLVETPELKALRVKRDGLQKQLDSMRKAAKPKKTQAEKDAASIKADINRTERAIGVIAGKIMQGDVKPTVVDKAKKPSTPELNALKNKLEQLQERYKEIRAVSVRTEAAEAAVQRSLDEIERKIREGDILPKGKGTPLSSQKLNSLKAQRDTRKLELERLREASPEYQKQRAEKLDEQYKQSLIKRLAQFEAQQKAGIYGQEKPKRVRQLDAEADAIRNILKTRKELAKDKFFTTPEQADKVANLAKEMADLKAKSLDGVNFDSLEDRMAYGVAAIKFRDYVNNLINAAKKKTFKEMVQHPLETFEDAFYKSFGLSKALRFTMDLSATLSQNITALTVDMADITLDLVGMAYQKVTKSSTNPLEYNDITTPRNIWKSWVDAWGELRGREMMTAIDADIVSRPNYLRGLYKKHGLAVMVSEENYPEHLYSKIPGVGRLFNSAEVAFTGLQKRQRVDIFDAQVALAESLSLDVMGDDIKGIGKLTNSVTARGNLDISKRFSFEPAADFLNLVFTAIRLMKSDADLLTGYQLNSEMSSFARKQGAYKSIKSIAVMAAMLALTELVRPGAVEWDDTKTTFGGIKIGDVIYMPFARFTKYLVLSARLAKKVYTTSAGNTIKLNTGVRGQPTQWTVLSDFIGNRNSPIYSVVRDRFQGENFDHTPPTFLGDVAKLTVPLNPETAVKYAVNKKVSIPSKIGAMLSETLGMRTAPVEYMPTTENQKLRDMQDDYAQRVYKKPFEDLNPDQQATINRVPSVVAQERIKKASYADKAYTFTQPQDEFDAGKRILSSLPGYIQEKLSNNGIDSVGIQRKITVNGEDFYLNDKRYKAYEDMLTAELKRYLPQLFGKRDEESIRKFLNDKKETVRNRLKREIREGRL